MPQNQKIVSFPLINVLIISLLVHVAAAIILGGYVIARSFNKEEKEFKPPPEIQKIQPEKIQYKQDVKEQQQNSAPPRPDPIQVPTPDAVSVPDIAVDISGTSPNVEVGAGSTTDAAAGAGGIGGGGSLDLETLEFNVLGLDASGEKIAIMVDAGERMLRDVMGGWPAFKVVKDEVHRVLTKMPNGYLFNVGYTYRGIGFFDPEGLVVKRAATPDKIAAWHEPFNSSNDALFNTPRNYSLKNNPIIDFNPDDYGPHPLRARGWVRMLVAAMEMQVDTIFIITRGYGRPTYIHYTSEERREHKLDNGLTEEDIKRNKEIKAKARAILKKRNAQRRKQGKPIRVVTHWNVIAKEEGWKIKWPPRRPEPSRDDLEDALERIRDSIYTEGMEEPSINLILYKPEKYPDEQVERAEERLDWVIDLGRGGDMKVIRGLGELKRASGSD